MKKFISFLFFTLCLLSCFSAYAQMQKEDSLVIQHNSYPKPNALKKTFSKIIHLVTDIDTSYVRRNYYRSSAMLYAAQRFNFYKLSGTDESKSTQSIYLSPHSSLQIGPYLGYSIFFLGYTIDIGTRKSSFDHSNIFLSIYSPIIGLDYYYEKGVNNYKIYKTSGFSELAASRIKDVDFPGLNTHLTNLHVYYIFNHKDFSYTAAYSQSMQQLRSRGTFTIGFNYTKQVLDFNYELLEDLLAGTETNSSLNNGLKVSRINYKDYSFSLGYSYNWVFAKNMLFNLTLTPTIGYNVNKGEKIDLNKKIFSREQFNFDLISRSALVWNTGKFFAGASCVAHTYSYRKSSFSILNALFSANAYIGFNFWRKKISH